MSGRVELVSYAKEAFAALAVALDDAKAGDPLAPVTVVAPSARAAIRLRRRLGSAGSGSRGPGLANVRFAVSADLAQGLGEVPMLAGGRRPLTRAALLAAVHTVLVAEPGYLRGVAHHPSTADEVARRYEELREAGPAALGRLSGRSGLARDLARLVRSVRAALEPDWFDDEDLLVSAGERARAGEAAGLGAVIVHLPERLSVGEAALLGELAVAVPVVAHLGLVGDAVADEHVHELARRLGLAGFALPGPGERGPVGRIGSDDPLAASTPVEAERVLLAPDAPAEARAGVRMVVERLEHGAAPERCALLYATPTPYLRLVGTLLDAARIPWSGPGPDTLAGTAPARLLAGLLGLATGGVRLGRGAVVEWLASAPVAGAGGRPVPVGEWDRASRLAGIVDEPPRAFADHLRRHAHELSNADRHVAEDGTRAARTADACMSMAAFVDTLGRSLTEARAATSWGELAAWSSDALDRFLVAGDPSTANALPDGDDELVRATLRELAALDGLDRAPDLERFTEAFAAACERPAARRPTSGRAVLVGPLEAAGGADLDLAVVLGTVEGVLPRRPVASPLLTAGDREAAGLEPLSARRSVERDRRRLLVALADAAVRVVTVAERDSRAGRSLLRSRFVPADRDERVPPLDGVLRRVAAGEVAAIDRTELECALLASTASTGSGALATHPVVAEIPALAAGLAVVGARAAYDFGRHAGLVVARGEDERALDETLLSPTSLEELATCPFRYFVGHVLDCEAVEEPERRIEIDARDRGSIVHEVLERFVRELLVEGAVVADATAAPPDAPVRALPAPAPTPPAPTGSRERLLQIAEETFVRYERLGLTGKAVLWEAERRRILSWLESERAADELRRAAGTRPDAVELAFGYGDVNPVVRTVRGRRLAFRGKIDRIDRAPDGAVTVVDYKTGSPKRFAGLREDGVDRGRHLQLPIYGLAARIREPAASGGPPKVRALFRFVGDEPVEYPIEVDAGVVERLDAVLAVLAGTIEAGAFPMRPGRRDFGGFENCGWCDFQVLCPADRDRYWGAASVTSPLAEYVQLVEPQEGEPADDG